MTPTQASKLSSTYPPLKREQLERRLPRMKRMQLFYEEKAPTAPGTQGNLFRGFASALDYAIAIIIRYDDLTKELAKLVEAEDENRLDS